MIKPSVEHKDPEAYTPWHDLILSYDSVKNIGYMGAWDVYETEAEKQLLVDYYSHAHIFWQRRAPSDVELSVDPEERWVIVRSPFKTHADALGDGPMVDCPGSVGLKIIFRLKK
jgi:hypothetical protein